MSNSAICIDASVVVDRIFRPQDARLGRSWYAWKSAARPLIAPQLLTYEVTNVIYQRLKAGDIIVTEARKAMRITLLLPIRLFAPAELHEKAIEMARDLTLGATYDAHYLALAWQEGAEFYTRDARLARAAQKYDWVRLLD